MDDRLRAIETRAKALGWDAFQMKDNDFICIYYKHPDSDHTELIGHFAMGNKGYAAAERLLACYEPGGMMRFYLKDVQGLGPKMMIDYDKSSIPDEPGDYKLIKVVE